MQELKPVDLDKAKPVSSTELEYALPWQCAYPYLADRSSQVIDTSVLPGVNAICDAFADRLRSELPALLEGHPECRDAASLRRTVSQFVALDQHVNKIVLSALERWGQGEASAVLWDIDQTLAVEEEASLHEFPIAKVARPFLLPGKVEIFQFAADRLQHMQHGIMSSRSDAGIVAFLNWVKAVPDLHGAFDQTLLFSHTAIAEQVKSDPDFAAEAMQVVRDGMGDQALDIALPERRHRLSKAYIVHALVRRGVNAHLIDDWNLKRFVGERCACVAARTDPKRKLHELPGFIVKAAEVRAGLRKR